MLRLMIVAALVAACTDPVTDDDADAEAQPFQPAGKDDGAAAAFVGLYATALTALHAGDVPSLELRDDGQYIRARCYHYNCAAQVAETDNYDLYTSASGKTYVRFWSFTYSRDANGELASEPAIADVYEIRTTATGIRLRKSYTGRWVALDATTPEAVCAGDGGTFGTDGCLCPGAPSGDGTTGYLGFLPAAGGCVRIPGGGEDACDSSDGFYTDDDATLVGTYCRCGRGRHVVDAGSCAPN